MDKCTELLNIVQSELDKMNSNNGIIDVDKVEQNIQSRIQDQQQTNKQTHNSLTTTTMIDMIKSFQTPEGCGERLEGIAIIQAFYGTDISRIEATTRALHFMLKSAYLPSEWVFVEAQHNKSNACFQWLKQYGVKYVFVKTTKQQDGIFLKTPLWNIGTQHCSAEKLCFIDSDVMFESDAWLKSAYVKFDNCNVMSVGGICKYEHNSPNEANSVGREYELNGSIVSKPHSGFTIGMTREIFNRINGFDACIILDDIWNWTRLLGLKTMNVLRSWIPFSIPDNEKNGYPIKLGSTNEKCMHLYHGDITNRNYQCLTNVIANKAASWDEIIAYDKSDFSILPSWNANTSIAKIAQKSILSILQGGDEDLTSDEIYCQNAKDILGAISNDNPLVICTYLVASFELNASMIQTMYRDLCSKCKNDFTFVVFTNETIDNDEITTIPLNNQFDEDKPWLQCFRKDVKFDKKSNVLFISPNMCINKAFELVNCEDTDFASNDEKTMFYFKSSIRLQKHFDSRNIAKYLNFIVK